MKYSIYHYITLFFLEKKKLLILLSSGMAAFLLSCSSNEGQKDPEKMEHIAETTVDLTKAQFEMAEIGLGKAEKRVLSNVLQVSGIMDVPPQNLISISAPLGGFVKNTKMLQGMRVKKGDILVVLEHPEYVQLQQDYLIKKSELMYLEKEFIRQKALNAEKVSADKVFQKAHAEYKAIKAEVNGLSEKLSFLGINSAQLTEDNISGKVNIYSPINGYVSAVNINIGKFVEPTYEMMELVNTDHLHAELTVYEKDIARLKIGQRIRFHIPNDSQHERYASVYLIGKHIDEDRSIHVHAHLENEDPGLMPGMYINASIELNERNVDAVPEDAIVMSEEKNYVFVLTNLDENGNYEFEMTEVEIGVNELGFMEIVKVNKPNMDLSKLSIVTNGAFTLLSKLKNTDDGD